MPITSAGVGSGLDIEGILTKLMAVERQPLSQLDRKEVQLRAKLTSYGSLKGAIASFQSSMDSMSALSKFQGAKASSADTSIFTASALSTAVAGTHSIEVKQLAQSQKLATGVIADATTDTIGTGSLTFQFGTDAGGVFTANAGKPSQTVTIDSNQSSLGGIRDAVNAAKIGVTASLVNDGSGLRLVFSANDTGAANGLKITVADTTVGDNNNTDNAGLSRLAYDPAATVGAGKNLSETVAAQDALLKVNGIDNIKKSSNTVTDVIEGVTLTLTKQSAVGSATTLTVTRDNAAVTSTVQSFVKAYNEVNAAVKDLTAYDPNTKRAAALQGDTAAQGVITQIRRVLSSTLTGLSGNTTALSQIGVSFQKDGTLTLDEKKLQAAMDSNINDIPALFARTGRSSHALMKFIRGGDATQAGTYAVSISQQATQGALNGSSTAALAHTNGVFSTPLTIDANNDSFSISVDGVASGAITLASGNYTTAAALTAEIQSKINGDAALKAAGASVTVSFDSAANRLVLTSDKYGSTSNVSISGADSGIASSYGLGSATGTAGVDVAGTINGLAANGVGRQLTAAGGVANGLVLEISGGDSATVEYSQGYASLLGKLAADLIADNSGLDSRTDGIDASIKNLESRRAILNERLIATERRLRAQFTAMDTLVAQLRTNGEYLSQQLDALTASNSRNR